MSKSTKKVAKNTIEKKEDIFTHQFSLNKLVMKESMWTGSFIVDTLLPKSYHSYFIQLTFNNQKYQDRVTALESQKKNVKSQPVLITDIQDAQIKRIDDQIYETKEEWEDMRAQCVSIEMYCTVQSIKWKYGKTHLEIILPDICIAEFNDKKKLMSYYLMVLEGKNR